jgi:acyl phosphate:glycerol-3-phosphate acyltransferase
MFLKVIVIGVISYLIGSIPVGLLVVKLFSGKDVRLIGSGRIGGTNVMRAAGLLAGILTAGLDAGKAILAGYLAGLLVPGQLWVKVAAVILAVVGQVYSIFLVRRDADKKLVFHGGAGGATTLGGAIALVPTSWMIILPLVVLVYIIIGYASVTTISIALFSLTLFLIRAINGKGPWEFVAYGAIALIIVLYALKPNLKRLREGTERAVGLRAYFQKKKESQGNK